MDQCVKSIVSQTYSNLEIILVDDGSPDSCPQKCDKWAEKDARIQVVHKKNGGLSSARNAGLKVATGDFISFIDSDDFIDEHTYEKLIEGFSLGDNVAITSIRIMRYINGNVSDFNKQWVYDSPRFIEGKDFLPMLIDLSFSNIVCNKLYRADLCRKVSFMEGRNNEDTLFNYFIGKELRKENSALVEMPYSAYFYRCRPDSICTSTKKPLIFDTLSNYDFMLSDISPDDIEMVEVLKKNKIYSIYLFLDLITLNKEQKQLYYNQFRGILKQFSHTEIKRALQLNDFIYALMHLYCPPIRVCMRKVLCHFGHYTYKINDQHQKMSKIMQVFKSGCCAIRLYLHRSRNFFLNLFFRHNNLLWALFIAKLKGNKIILGKNIKFRHCKFEINGTGNYISIKDNCILSGLRIYVDSSRNRLVIGKNTIVNASKEQKTMFNPCEGGEILIGDNCLFSNNIEIHTTDYHKIFVHGRRENVPQNITIGSHCWIGLQCLILKGTTLADNCIVGARSLLNKKYDEPNSVIVGSPARIVKTNVTWNF